MASASHIDRAAELRRGQEFGPYRIECLIGEGGMGYVYKAIALDGEAVALKLIKPTIAKDPAFRRRFEREIKVAQRISHRHIAKVVDAGEVGGAPYVALEFIQGGSLADKIQHDGPLPLESAVRTCLQTASGLEAIHELKLVHRDLKPANVLLDDEQSAKITDFGLVKDKDASVLTKAGQTLGSLDYMAPEQIRGHEVTPLTDVYALGCLMCECISGEPPFADRHGMQILWAHLQDEMPDPCASRPDVPKDLSWAIRSALAKEPSRRPPSAMAYARMVQLAAGVPPMSP
jgi:serine/threonine protein kinase